MTRTLLALLIATALVAGCGSSSTEPTSDQGTEPRPTAVEILPTPTPVPPPPTPTPIPEPTDTPVPEPTATPEPDAEPTATPAEAQPTPTEAPPEEPAPSVPDIMVQVPAGTSVMGSDGAGGDETPAHQVDLPAFEIDQFEVTNADFATFVQVTGYKTTLEEARSTSAWQKYTEGKANHPVVKVSWHDAVAYCEWLGKRLPSEAEWEKAARGSEGYAYPWGNDYDAQKANGKDRAIRSTTAVGSFPEGASPYGAMDMSGNVWEWTADWYQAYPGSSHRSDYFGEKFRVLRGGGWFETADFLRTTTRNANTDTAASDDIGFRCAR